MKNEPEGRGGSTLTIKVVSTPSGELQLMMVFVCVYPDVYSSVLLKFCIVSGRSIHIREL